MRIWLITIGEPLPNVSESKKLRTALLADELVKRGHHILSFVSAYNHLKKEWVYQEDRTVKIRDNYYLQVIKGSGYRKNISLQRFIDHRIIARKFSKVAVTIPKPDIIITSMPPHDLAHETVLFAKQNNIPVLVDIRDPWPDLFFQNFPSAFRKQIKFIFRNEFRMLKGAMKYANGLLATTSTLLDWGLKYAQREKSENDKVFYLGHKRKNDFAESLIDKKNIKTAKELDGKFIIFFVGTIANYHNPLILVHAAKKLLKKYSDIHFVIAGDGELLNELKRESENLSNVSLLGWLNSNEIEFWLKKCTVGACITPKTIDIIPNKTGTYLSAKLPVISAFQGDLKKLVEKYQIGFNYPPNNVNELTKCILKLYEDKTLYTTMSENAKKVFTDMFDADKIYSEYANHIELIVENRRIGKS